MNQEILMQNYFNPALLNNPSQNEKMEAMSLKAERTQDYLAFEVEKAYMQLQLAYKAGKNIL